MKVEVLKPFRDQQEHTDRFKDDQYVTNKDRAEYLEAAGYVIQLTPEVLAERSAKKAAEAQAEAEAAQKEADAAAAKVQEIKDKEAKRIAEEEANANAERIAALPPAQDPAPTPKAEKPKAEIKPATATRTKKASKPAATRETKPTGTDLENKAGTAPAETPPANTEPVQGQ